MVWPNNYTRLSDYYINGWISEQDLRKHVVYGTITAAEFKLITDKDYKQVG